MTTRYSSRNGWFTVDVDGLQSLASRRPPAWWLHELIQNSLDEPGVSSVFVTMTQSGNSKVRVIVEDDAPAGWADLSTASTMFARSSKADDPERRGRFNLGEKLFLSICETATIESTAGRLQFMRDGRRRLTDQTRERGTKIEAIVHVDPDQIDELVRLALMTIVPRHVYLEINGRTRARIEPIAVAKGPLPTEFDNGDGHIRRSTRRTTVEVFPVLGGESPHIFEMGIPICAHDGDHHLNVGQVVPMGIERQAVTPGYLTKVYGLALDAVTSAGEMTEEMASTSWATDGMAAAAPSSVAETFTARFGQDMLLHPLTEGNQPMQERDVFEPSSDAAKAAWSDYLAAKAAEEQAAADRDSARARYIAALAEEAGLEVGDRITVRRVRRAFVERFGVQRNLFHAFGIGKGDDPEPFAELAVYYRKAKKNGEPYAIESSYPVTRFTKGWDDDDQ